MEIFCCVLSSEALRRINDFVVFSSLCVLLLCDDYQENECD